LFPTFLVEGNAKFQLEISENRDVIFFLSKFMDPRLRTPALNPVMVFLIKKT
jgi:hypothetical protein